MVGGGRERELDGAQVAAKARRQTRATTSLSLVPGRQSLFLVIRLLGVI